MNSTMAMTPMTAWLTSRSDGRERRRSRTRARTRASAVPRAADDERAARRVARSASSGTGTARSARVRHRTVTRRYSPRLSTGKTSSNSPGRLAKAASSSPDVVGRGAGEHGEVVEGVAEVGGARSRAAGRGSRSRPPAPRGAWSSSASFSANVAEMATQVLDHLVDLRRRGWRRRVGDGLVVVEQLGDRVVALGERAEHRVEVADEAVEGGLVARRTPRAAW